MGNVIETGETKEELLKRKRDERKNTLHEGELQEQFVETTRNIAHKFSGKWVFEERDRGHVICSSGAGTKNQFYQSKDRQTTRFSQM